MTETNRRVLLARRPVGLPAYADFTFDEVTVPELAEGQILIKVLYVSLDPAMRGWMREGRSYAPPVGIGEVMRAFAAGRVVASRNPGFAAGDAVTGLFGVQSFLLSDGQGINKVDTRLAWLPSFIGVLGMPGMTAYFGLLDVGRLNKGGTGETVVVSAAAGAVGALVGQIAKIHGCRVVGIAGGAEKCGYIVKELGFDAAIDYKAEDVRAALRTHCPKGIDIYFDNVGGEILDAALANLARGARIVLCGAISQYNVDGPWRGPANYFALLVARGTMTGFVVSDFVSRWAEGVRAVAGWMAEGKIRSREDVVAGGIERFPDTLLKLYKSENFGKLILEIASA
jgi:NADPH-dependent curcumin reductase CurA